MEGIIFDTGPLLWDEPQESLDQRHRIIQLIMKMGFRGNPLFHSKEQLQSVRAMIIEKCINIRHGAILGTLEENGWLHIDPKRNQSVYRAALEKPNPMMIERFLRAGFDPNYYDAGETRRHDDLPLNLLGDAGRIGHHPPHENHDDLIPLSLDPLENYGDPIDRLKTEYAAAVKLLLDYGAKMDSRVPASGLTTLFHLVSNPEIKSNCTPLASRVQVLLEMGANPFSSCNEDETLIEIAVRQRDIAIMKVLLEFFDQRDFSFAVVKAGVKRALQTSRALKMLKMESVLSRWYWRRENSKFV